MTIRRSVKVSSKPSQLDRAVTEWPTRAYKRIERLVDDLAEERLQRARAGDGSAFGEWLAPVLDPAFRLAMTMLNERAAAEDAVQDASFKAWRNLDHFRSGAELRPWFLSIVANECRTVRR